MMSTMKIVEKELKSNLRKHKYEEMLPYEFFKELDSCAVAWMPCGLLEWHE